MHLFWEQTTTQKNDVSVNATMQNQNISQKYTIKNQNTIFLL